MMKASPSSVHCEKRNTRESESKAKRVRDQDLILIVEGGGDQPKNKCKYVAANLRAKERCAKFKKTTHARNEEQLSVLRFHHAARLLQRDVARGSAVPDLVGAMERVPGVEHRVVDGAEGLVLARELLDLLGVRNQDPRPDQRRDPE